MKKERIKQSLLALAGALLTPALPLGANAFDSGLDQGAEINLSLGNTGAESTGSTGSQDVTPQGEIAPQGSTLEVAGIPVPTYEEFLALSDSEKLALFEQLNALDDTTLDNLTPEQMARVEPIFRWASEQTAVTEPEGIWVWISQSGNNNCLLTNGKNVTATLKTDGTISLTVEGDSKTYTVPGTAPGYDGTTQYPYNRMRVSGSTLTLKLENSAQVWTWTEGCCPIEFENGSIFLETTNFRVNTGANAFLNSKRGTLSISNATITNEGTGPVVRGEGGGSLSLNSVNFTSNGRTVELGDSGSSVGTPTINITGGIITGSPAVYAGSANDKISSVTIQGATLDGKGGNGIYVNSNARATLTNTTIRNCGYGINVQARTASQDAYATISNCTITDNVQNMACLYSRAMGQKAYFTIQGNNAVTSTAGADIVCDAFGATTVMVDLNVKVPKNDNNPWLISSTFSDTRTILGDSGNMNTQYIKAYNPHCHIYIDNTSTTERIALSNHNPSWSITSDSAKGTITAHCTVDGCKFRDPMTLTATVEKSHIYDGTAVSAAVTGADAMTAAGLTVTTKYYKGNTELSPAPSDIGSYTAKVTVASGDQSGTLELPFAIVAPIEGVQNLVYNGKAQNLVQPGTLPADVKVLYKQSDGSYSETAPTGTNAGAYTVEYYMTNASGNIYGTPETPNTLNVTIAKATPKLTIDTLTHEYDGKVFAPTVTADTDEVTNITVICRDMTGKYVGPRNAGDYTVEATSAETTNYKSANTGGSLEITPKEVGVTWSNLELVYNGSYQSPTATVNQQDLAEGDRTLSLAVTEGMDAGTYTAKAYVKNNNNYRISTESWREFTIKPKEVAIVWGEGDFTYTGSAQVPTAAVQAGALIGSDTTSVTVTGQQTDASDTPYTATAVLGNSNYTPANPTQEFTIKKFTPTPSDVKASIPANTKDIAKVTVSGSWDAPSALGSLPGKLEPKEGQTLTWGENGLNVITCVFTPTDTTNIASVEVPGVEVQMQDTEKPNVTYKLNGKDWSTEQYLNKDAQVTVTVTDAVSGFKSGEYAIQWDDQSSSSLEWKSIPESGEVTVTVPAEHGKSFQICVRAIDNAGNNNNYATTTPCNFITQPPVIGLDANKTYYVTTEFTVSGMEITSVTRKNNTSGVTDTIGSAAGDNFLLVGNTDTTYTVTATDKAGNVTTVTVTMKPIASILDPLTGVTEDNVTTDNEETVKHLSALCEELKNTSGIKSGEVAAVTEVAEKLSKLQNQIDIVKRLYNNALKYASITPETVTKSDLDKILEGGGIEAIIDDFVSSYGGNLTGDQKAKLAEIKQNLRAAQDLLKQVSDLEAEINALPNSVEPDDVDAVTRVRDLRSARASLSDHAQKLIDGMCNAKLDALWAQATTYKVIRGDGKVWMRSEGDYEVVANGPYDWFTQLLIDGETVEPDSYTAASGSTVVTLPKAYMDDLKDGKHTVVFVYENDGPLGQAEGSFTVQTPTSGSPRTGDENNMLPYGIAIAAALAALAVLFVPKKRKKQ